VFALGREMAPDGHGNETLHLRGPFWSYLLKAVLFFLLGLFVMSRPTADLTSAKILFLIQILLFGLSALHLLFGLGLELVLRRRLEINGEHLSVTKGLAFLKQKVTRPIADHDGVALVPIRPVFATKPIWLVVAWHEDDHARTTLAAHRRLDAAHTAWRRLARVTGLDALVLTADGIARPLRVQDVLQRSPSSFDKEPNTRRGLREETREGRTNIFVPIMSGTHKLFSLLLFLWVVLALWLILSIAAFLWSDAHPYLMGFSPEQAVLLLLALVLGLFWVPTGMTLFRRRFLVLRDGSVFWVRLLEGGFRRDRLDLNAIEYMALIKLKSLHGVGSGTGLVLFSDDHAMLIDPLLSRENADWLMTRLARAVTEARTI
jgi:hypothetical protein